MWSYTSASQAMQKGFVGGVCYVGRASWAVLHYECVFVSECFRHFSQPSEDFSVAYNACITLVRHIHIHSYFQELPLSSPLPPTPRTQVYQWSNGRSEQRTSTNRPLLCNGG